MKWSWDYIAHLWCHVDVKKSVSLPLWWYTSLYLCLIKEIKRAFKLLRGVSKCSSLALLVFMATFRFCTLLEVIENAANATQSSSHVTPATMETELLWWRDVQIRCGCSSPGRKKNPPRVSVVSARGLRMSWWKRPTQKGPFGTHNTVFKGKLMRSFVTAKERWGKVAKGKIPPLSHCTWGELTSSWKKWSYQSIQWSSREDCKAQRGAWRKAEANRSSQGIKEGCCRQDPSAGPLPTRSRELGETSGCDDASLSLNAWF